MLFGTVSVFVPDLQHEGRIYQRLEAMQGEVVPVHLGNINLVRKYDLDLVSMSFAKANQL
jgi:hypothetical protein